MRARDAVDGEAPECFLNDVLTRCAPCRHENGGDKGKWMGGNGGGGGKNECAVATVKCLS